MENEKDTLAETIEVKLNFRMRPGMASVYAHHMIVQPGEHEVILSFFEIIPPLVNTPDQVKYLRETGLMADCIARITVAKERFPLFAMAMQQVLSQLSSEQQEEQSNAGSSRNNQQS